MNKQTTGRRLTKKETKVVFETYPRGCTRATPTSGRLGPEWKDRFEGMTIIERTSPDPRGITEPTVPIADQAALLGVLGQLSGMQCALLSVDVLIEDHRLDNQPQTRRNKGD